MPWRRADVTSPRVPPPAGPQLLLSRTARRVAVVALALIAVSVIRYLANQPSLAISLYALLPIVLSVYWFGFGGGLATATVATLLFLADELFAPSAELGGGMLWVAGANRAVVFVGVAALVAALLRRERGLTTRLRAQQDQLDEFQALRAALTPTEVPVRPQLQIATAFTPAEGLVAGDFFLVVEGPADSTTVVVGDVVGHGLEAARCAAFVRAALATFARFTGDPAQLLQLADVALTEHGLEDARFVTAVCLNVAAPPQQELVWATAGHDIPWLLDTGLPLKGGRIGPPLGTGTEPRPIEAGRTALAPGEGVLVFTDGLTEGRPRRSTRPLSLFGEDRARRIVREQQGAPVGRVLEALSAAVTDFAGGPLADDLCLVALRAEAPATA
jgi:serine phosphatase RsbU (regulator of sigma subunit)